MSYVVIRVISPCCEKEKRHVIAELASFKLLIRKQRNDIPIHLDPSSWRIPSSACLGCSLSCHLFLPLCQLGRLDRRFYENRQRVLHGDLHRAPLQTSEVLDKPSFRRMKPQLLSQLFRWLGGDHGWLPPREFFAASGRSPARNARISPLSRVPLRSLALSRSAACTAS